MFEESVVREMNEIALQIFDVGAFKDRRQSPNGLGFKLKLHEKNPASPLSPYFLNLRTPANPKPGPLTPDLVKKTAWIMGVFLRQARVPFDYIAGIPRAGEPFAGALAELAGKPLLRLKKWESGGYRHIIGLDGDYRLEKAVLLVDDVATEADTKAEAAKVALEAGLIARHVVVVVDREQGAEKRLKKFGLTLLSIFKIRELLEIYLAEGRITEEIYEDIDDYLPQT